MNTLSSATGTIRQDINRVAEAVADYLMPKVAYVGDNDDVLATAQAALNWVEHTHLNGARDHEVLIVDGTLFNEAGVLDTLPVHSILIICHLEAFTYPNAVKRVLAERLAVSLREPTGDEISFHVRSLLLVREALYGLPPTLLSVTPGYRARISEIIQAVSRQQSLMVDVDSMRHGDALLDFLFRDANKSIRPVLHSSDDFSVRELISRRYNVLRDPPRTVLKAIQATLKARRDNAAPMPLFIVRVVTRQTKPVDVHDVQVALPLAADRLDDVTLLAYLTAIALSHAGDRISYVKQDTQQRLMKRHEKNFYVLGDAMKKHLVRDGGERTPKTMLSLLQEFDRLSLPSVMSAIEDQVLEYLYDRSTSVDAVSLATGIPAVTYFKKRQRHRDRPSILGLDDQQ